MILDLAIETGNPSDRDRLLPMLERHIAFYGQAPRQAVADGGFASRDNLAQAKTQGVRNMAFHNTASARGHGETAWRGALGAVSGTSRLISGLRSLRTTSRCSRA
jgi:IS5 family transposase